MFVRWILFSGLVDKKSEYYEECIGSPGKSHRKYLGIYKRVYGEMLILKNIDSDIEN